MEVIQPGTVAMYRGRKVVVISYHDEDPPLYWVQYVDTGTQTWAPPRRVTPVT